MNNNTQLLCTFTQKNKLNDTITDIKKTYAISFGRIFVLENIDNERELMCTYNINLNSTSNETLKNTISIHRKKETNSLYTINALNHVVSLLNDGNADPNYKVDWERFKNTLLVTDDEGLKEIKTKIHQIIDL